MGARRSGAILAFCVGMAGLASAQVNYHGDKGGMSVSAGAAGTGYYIQYGERKMTGISAFVDVDPRGHLGIEGEGRWIEFRQAADVHMETYSIGARYHFNIGRFQPYAKGLVGFGDFNFPYNLATGRYLVVTGGGGADYQFTSRIQIRVADVEYQDWPQFTFGNMTALSASVGLRVRIFR